ncbi:MAG: translation initiation factor IF-3 [Planctomycetaceae bacterium]|nr:translation initiation factor IF-3 [Planctomycetaceae bacterium]MDC0273641.1 translation initiation factor IF-3 [Planctomycetaceae bacterium]MDG2390049.1 translation initiation factor IF-3 [Planctomycetaceae bacterium]
MNEEIQVTPIRVVNEEGEMLGEMAIEDALKMAKEAELDLVEINPDDTPPVCKIMDFGKVQYERRKKQTGGTKKTHQQQLKQIRLRAKTGQHDIDFKMKKVREFLGRKDKVKINVLFRGRENAHHERGREMLQEIGESLKDVADIERAPFMESGRSMSMLVGPKS